MQQQQNLLCKILSNRSRYSRCGEGNDPFTDLAKDLVTIHCYVCTGRSIAQAKQSYRRPSRTSCQVVPNATTKAITAATVILEKTVVQNTTSPASTASPSNSSVKMSVLTAVGAAAPMIN